MPARTSKAVWNGDLQSGTGQMVVMCRSAAAPAPGGDAAALP
jgi:hypothetical protein